MKSQAMASHLVKETGPLKPLDGGDINQRHLQIWQVRIALRGEFVPLQFTYTVELTFQLLSGER